MCGWLGIDTSFVAGIPLIKGSIEVDYTSGFGISHSLSQWFWDPGIIIFHNELCDLCPLVRRKGLKLLDQLSSAHIVSIIYRVRTAK